jgi:hypothetical protein
MSRKKAKTYGVRRRKGQEAGGLRREGARRRIGHGAWSMEQRVWREAGGKLSSEFGDQAKGKKAQDARKESE